MNPKPSNHFDIPEIKDRVTIWKVLQHFGNPVPERDHAICSPLRDERSPSFSIFGGGEAAKDHATGESYDCISLYQALAGCSKHEAIAGCGALAGLQAGEIPPSISVPPPPRSSIATPSKKSQRKTLRDKLGPYTPERRDQMTCLAASFLDGKEDGDESNCLTVFCKNKKIELQYMKRLVSFGAVGVLSDPNLRDPCIAWMFSNPIHGHGCKLRLDPLSSHKTLWWEGRSTEHVFGENFLQMMSEKYVVLTEGESDAIVLLQAGIPAYGILGSKVQPCPKLVHFLLAYQKLFLIFDKDNAGREAEQSLAEYIRKEATGSSVLTNVFPKIPEGKDIGDCWEAYGERFIAYLKKGLDEN